MHGQWVGGTMALPPSTNASNSLRRNIELGQSQVNTVISREHSELSGYLVYFLQ